MATKKPAKPTPKPKATPKPTVKPTQAPSVQKKSVPKPLLVVGGSMSLGSCALACLCLLMRQGGSKSGGVPNVLGLRVPANAKPSGLPATMLSGIVLSVCVGMVASIIFMVLTRQRRMTDAARAELYSKFFDALRRRTAADVERAARHERAQRRSKALEQRDRQVTVANSWISQPFMLPDYKFVEMFVLLGKVLSEHASVEDAKKVCNDTGSATHIQVEKTTGRAAVKTILEIPANFGTTGDTSTSLKSKCGEGYHPNYTTLLHPRLFLLNEANSILRRSWEDLTIEDLDANQNAQQDKKDELNARCFLGLESGTCRWNSKWKDILLGIVTPIVTAGLTEGISAVFLHGLRLIPQLIGEAILLGGELSLSIALPLSLNKAQEAEAEQLVRRFENLKNGMALSNRDIGGKDSYNSIVDRLHQEQCSKRDMSGFTMQFYANKNHECDQVPCGPIMNWNSEETYRRYAPYQWALLDKLKAYEALPGEPWNCDEITETIQVSKLMGRVLMVQRAGVISGGKIGLNVGNARAPPRIFVVHPNGANACAEADAQYKG